MTRSFSVIGVLRLLRRLMVAAIMFGAALLADAQGLGVAGLAVLVAVVVYVVTCPRLRAPIRYAIGPVVVGPDWLGFLWLAGFAAGPILLSDGWSSVDTFDGLHPSAWLLWPIALAEVSFLIAGWRAESFGLRFAPFAIDMTRGLRRWHLSYDKIAAHRPWRRDLPRWMRALAPLLLGSNPTAAGALLLARPRKGVELLLRQGGSLIIETDALLPNPHAVEHAMDAAGVARGRAQSRISGPSQVFAR